MMEAIDKNYFNWLNEVKTKLKSVQSKAVLAVNSLLIEFYWELGKAISEKETGYGTGFLKQVSKDLKSEFPEMTGLSYRNLAFCRQFYLFYSSLSILQQPVAILSKQPVNRLVQQLVVQIPWGHNILIFTKSATIEQAEFYILETIENGWSREVLALQIKSQLYERQGKSINNFQQTLPRPLSDLANETLKDPYIFDFLTLSKSFHEKDIEKQLIAHITKFLLELGKGFAFIGQQYHLEVGESDYYIDLLFYHTRLKCYVVIELKNTKFKPEYSGKLNFYLSAVDSLVKQEDDKPTIGILLCRDKNNIETEFALRDLNKPIGVSEFSLTEIVPEELKSSLPSVEEIENELKKLE